jgi:hypothetical protein
MTLAEKLDVVIQGSYTDFTDDIIDSYLKIPFIDNIIVSCWDDNKQSKCRDNVKFIRNQYPSSSGTDNKNLQIATSLNGLKESSSKFSIKTRSDHKFTYDSMMKMYDFFIQYNQRILSYQYDDSRPKNRILVAGIYADLLFHPRDHLFWGHTEDLVDLFDIPLEKNGLVDIVKVPKERLWMYYEYFIRTETYLGSHYCSNFNDEIIRFLLLPKEHLYDNAVYWNHCKQKSDELCRLVFKSFPKDAIQFDWFRSISKQTHLIGRSSECLYLNTGCWHEDGF